jgi:FkbM family methyltransferase
VIRLACYINRNLRFGNTSNKLFQYFVIKTRYWLKRFINNKSAVINRFDSVTIQLKYAGKMELYPGDYIDTWLYTGADFEPHIVRLFLKFLEPGDHVLDIGANIGYFSLIASGLVGEGGKVYAFEPSPLNLERLRKNIQLNNHQNVLVIPKAVSNNNGTFLINLPVGPIKNSGRSSFRVLEEQSEQVTVETLALDVLRETISKISLVKMDIEGAEEMALSGMEKLIERDQPVIILELSDFYLRQLGSSAESVINFLKNLGYKIYIAGEEIILLESIDMLTAFQHDILCLPRGQNYQD